MDTVFSFGEWVRQQRRFLRLTQVELAQLVGCSPILIRKIETDERRPSHQIAALLARHLGIAREHESTFVHAARAELAIDRLPPPGRRTTGYQAIALVRQTRFVPPALPFQPIGRDQELSMLQGLLAHSRLVTLVGPPGVGKTTLALAVAQKLRESYRDGAAVVLLAPVTDPQLIALSIMRAIGAMEQPGRPALETLQNFLRSRQLLLILDNVEQLLDGIAELSDLLAAAPELTLLVTSRVLLRLRGEQRFSVMPLSVAAATELFAQRAQQIWPERSQEVNGGSETGWPAGAQQTIEAIVERLDRIPLAIELAAARLRIFTLGELMQRLQQRLPLLIDGPRDAPLRHRTLRAAVAWSYSLLTSEEQAGFRRLGVFVYGFTREAAGAVISDAWNLMPSADPALTETLLLTLLDHSLVTRTDDRFGMLETLREYALERLLEAGEEEATRARHAAYFAQFADQAVSRLNHEQQLHWLTRLNADMENLRASLVWLFSPHDLLTGVQMVACMGQYWSNFGPYYEALGWLTQALEAVPPDRRLLRAQLLLDAGICIHLVDNNERSVRWLQESLAIAQEHGDLHGMAEALRALALPLRKQCDFSRAHQVLQQSLPLYQQVGDRNGEAWVLFLSGLLALDQAQFDQSLELLLAGRKAFAEAGDHIMADWVCYNLGHVSRLQGELEAAERFYRIALDRYQSLTNRSSTAEIALGLGHVMRLQGQTSLAGEIYRRYLSDLYEAGNRRRVADCLDGLAAVYARDGELIRAAQLMGASQLLRERIAIPIAPAELPEYERQVKELRSALPPADYDRAWEEGRSLSLEQTIALGYALPDITPAPLYNSNIREQ